MKIRIHYVAFATLALLPGIVAAQQANPVADAFRDNAKQEGKNLMAAAEEFPADKFSFKPTPAQMSFGAIVVHLTEANDYLCGSIGGVKAPTRTKVDADDAKPALIARLKETFAFCDQALAPLNRRESGRAASLLRRTKDVSRGNHDRDHRRLGRPLQPSRRSTCV